MAQPAGSANAEPSTNWVGKAGTRLRGDRDAVRLNSWAWAPDGLDDGERASLRGGLTRFGG